MDKKLLKKHINEFLQEIKNKPEKSNEQYQERIDHINFYQKYSKEKILSMDKENMYNYLSTLWAMLIWGNKHYVIDKIIDDNGFDNLKKNLAELVWGNDNIEKRWDNFRKNIKGLGPAMMSEILCKTHPNKYMVWNRRAYIAFNYLDVENLPRYDYQLTGEVYNYLCEVSKEIAKELEKANFKDTTLLSVDYFIWDQLQVEDNLSKIYGTKPPEKEKKTMKELKSKESEFVHNDIRDKLRDIGQWLGFDSKIEQKVAEGAKLDTIWEATIGNMGRVIYVFEVQTKGSVDSLIVNLLKSLNNPAVQGVVAVSDIEQIEKIKKHSQEVKDLKDKLKFWDYEEVLKIHESLEYVNESINNLDLVPKSFY
jgi:hypothetical protein